MDGEGEGEDDDDASRARLAALRRRSTALLERGRVLTERLERRRREREGDGGAVTRGGEEGEGEQQSGA